MESGKTEGSVLHGYSQSKSMGSDESNSHLGLESGKFFNISSNQDCDAKLFAD
jgi:hypothetical protein